jgi:hypothetical protein
VGNIFYDKSLIVISESGDDKLLLSGAKLLHGRLQKKGAVPLPARQTLMLMKYKSEFIQVKFGEPFFRWPGCRLHRDSTSSGTETKIGS